MLLVNTTAWRLANLTQKTLELARHPGLRFHDQDAINLALPENQVMPLPLKWNILSLSGPEDYLRQIAGDFFFVAKNYNTNPGLIHYIGPAELEPPDLTWLQGYHVRQKGEAFCRSQHITRSHALAHTGKTMGISLQTSRTSNILRLPQRNELANLQTIPNGSGTQGSLVPTKVRYISFKICWPRHRFVLVEHVNPAGIKPQT